MKVKIEKLELGGGAQVFYHLANATTGDLLHGSKGWVSERGPRAMAKRLGAEIVE